MRYGYSLVDVFGDACDEVFKENKMSEGNKYLKYKCGSCGAEDTLGLFEHEPVPAAVNCWKCHAGHGVEMQAMLTGHVGMFPAPRSR